MIEGSPSRRKQVSRDEDSPREIREVGSLQELPEAADAPGVRIAFVRAPALPGLEEWHTRNLRDHHHFEFGYYQTASLIELERSDGPFVNFDTLLEKRFKDEEDRLRTLLQYFKAMEEEWKLIAGTFSMYAINSLTLEYGRTVPFFPLSPNKSSPDLYVVREYYGSSHDMLIPPASIAAYKPSANNPRFRSRTLKPRIRNKSLTILGEFARRD